MLLYHSGFTTADHRPSAIGVGSMVGLIFMVTLVVMIVASDIPVLKKHVRIGWRRMKGVSNAKVSPTARKGSFTSSSVSAAMVADDLTSGSSDTVGQSSCSMDSTNV